MHPSAGLLEAQDAGEANSLAKFNNKNLNIETSDVLKSLAVFVRFKSEMHHKVLLIAISQ